jgi:hypothetical protein
MDRPALPTNISSDGRELWDWIAQVSEWQGLIDERDRLTLRINHSENVCGSCTKWMTKHCPREVHNNKIGRSQGPSMNAQKCNEFTISVTSANLVREWKMRVAEINKQVQEKA